MSVSALSTTNLASPSISGVGAARPLYFKSLSNAGIAALTSAQIGEMRSVEMAALSDSQIKAFNPAALASGLPTYLNNKQVLPTTFISSLGNNQISQFGAPLVNATLSKMSVTQIGAIHTSAISGIGAAALQSLSGAQLSGFTQAQVAQASTTQIASLKPQQISALSPGWLNVLSSSQLQSLGSASIAALTKTQIAGMDAAHVKDLSAAQVASLSKVQLGALNGSQIAAIDATDIKAMTTSQFGALTKTQLQALTVGQIGQVDAFQIRTISAKNFASLYTNQVAAFTTKAVANLGGTQIAAMTKEQISQGLDPAKIGALSASRLRYFNPSQISALTNPEVAAISLSTMKTLYDPHLRAFTVDQLSHLSEDKIDWLINKKLQITGCTQEQKSAILARKAAFANNAAPTVANAIADQVAYRGAAFSFVVPINTFADTNTGATLSYSATRADGSALPRWLQFDANTRTFSGTAGSTDLGVLNLKVIAADAVGASVSSAFKVTVGAGSTNPTKQWTQLLGTNVDDGAFAMTTGADGSFYVSGVTFGPLDGQTASGDADAFITKFNPDGTKQWTRLLGTGAFDMANALKAGSDGSIYVSGYTFNNYYVDGQKTSSGDADAFITKFSANGTKEWTQLLGTSSWDEANAMTVGADGAVYVSGYNYAYAAGNGQSLSGSFDAFITKFNSNGSQAWTKAIGSNSDDVANAMTTGKDGSIYVSGITGGSMYGHTHGVDFDAFITQFNPDGTKGWTRALSTSADDFATAMTTGADGAIYVGGYTYGSLDGQTNSSGMDAFISKFNPDGTKYWTKLLGGSGVNQARALTTGADGEIYVSGYANGSLGGQANSGGSDFFVTKYSPDGTQAWTQLLGTSSDDIGQALTTGADGSIYVAGVTAGNLDGQTNSGNRDAFITKYST